MVRYEITVETKDGRRIELNRVFDDVVELRVTLMDVEWDAKALEQAVASCLPGSSRVKCRRIDGKAAILRCRSSGRSGSRFWVTIDRGRAGKHQPIPPSVDAWW